MLVFVSMSVSSVSSLSLSFCLCICVPLTVCITYPFLFSRPGPNHQTGGAHTRQHGLWEVGGQQGLLHPEARHAR